MINKTWKVIQLETTPVVDAYQNVATTVLWKLTLTDTVTNKEVTFSDTTSLPPPGSAEFIPLNQLTETIVIDWVKSVLGEANITALETMLTNRLTEVSSSTGLPWQA